MVNDSSNSATSNAKMRRAAPAIAAETRQIVLKEQPMEASPTVAAEPFDYDKPAELFPPRTRVSGRPSYGYMRFDRAADAIRFAIERLPPKLLLGACLEIDEVRINCHGIRRLYDSVEYPLVRRVTT
jgi:hypothetical protein